MTHQDLCDFFGSAAEAARKLGKSRGTLTYWKNNGIPFPVQCVIERETKRKLRADKNPAPEQQAA